MMRKFLWLFLCCVMAVTLVAWSCDGIDDDDDDDDGTGDQPTTVTLTMAVSGSGSTTPAAGAHEYDEDEVVDITATPASGWQFNSWTGDVAISASAQTTVTMDTSQTVTANFSQLPVGMPLYGGTLRASRNTNLTYFDEVTGGNYGGHVYCAPSKLTHSELLQGDWTLGPAGTYETGFLHGGDNRMDQKTGCLADSWEIPEIGTIIFHIREGVRWQDKEPVNGRLLTVDDIVYSIERALGGGYFAYFYAAMSASLEVTSDAAARTVTVTVPTDQWVNMITLIPDYMSIYPPEVEDKTMWENTVGTGPFIFDDFIDNSTATFVRNPDYWETDPIGPGMGNQLPYVDEYVWLIIVDPSIREAAFRSGQIDSIGPINVNEAEPILDDSSLFPLLGSTSEYSDGSTGLYMRTDDPESPFSIKEVRQAMMLAIDQPLIRDSYWQGEGVLLTHPIMPTKPYMDAYMPLEEMP
jgi:ABC-type transport system substrate-binding protein